MDQKFGKQFEETLRLLRTEYKLEEEIKSPSSARDAIDVILSTDSEFHLAGNLD